MRFARKIFIAVFLTTVALGTTLVWLGHNYVIKQTKEDFIARYSTLSKVMGDTLTRLDTSTEAHMLNAAKVIAERDKQKGLLSTAALKGMRDELNVTHIFVQNKNGTFIRSTNEDPSLIPNAFSFCGDYRNMIAGSSNVEATPIIQPQPEPKPYKFLFIPNHNRGRLIEVGVRVDFVAKTLKEALGADANIVSMSLYSPDGNSFARFNSKDFQFKTGKESLPSMFPAVVESKDLLHVYTKVASSHPRCCQCDVSGTSRNGEYYYILESEVSKNELATVLASTQKVFVLLALANLVLAYLLSRFVARRLVRNIRLAVEKVREIKSTGSLEERIKLEGKDEVAFLTNEFDRMLDSLKESQRSVVENEKAQAKIQLAKEVAHNIRSPILAIEMMIPMLVRLPERVQKVFRDSARDIKVLAERLDRQSNLSTTPVNLEEEVESLVHKKRVEYSQSTCIEFEYAKSVEAGDLFVLVDPVEFRSLLSNLINNAAESYPNRNGQVRVTTSLRAPVCIIEIADSGKGIPEKVISQVGSKSVTFEKEGGKGLGLLHAHRVVREWGGQIQIESELNRGTKVKIVLPALSALVRLDAEQTESLGKVSL